MKHLRAPLAACILAAGLVGCGDSAVSLVAPERPHLNGYTYGSGHRVASDTTESSSAATISGTTADEGTVERGGYTYGSGH